MTRSMRCWVASYNPAPLHLRDCQSLCVIPPPKPRRFHTRNRRSKAIVHEGYLGHNVHQQPIYTVLKSTLEPRCFQKTKTNPADRSNQSGCNSSDTILYLFFSQIESHHLCTVLCTCRTLQVNRLVRCCTVVHRISAGNNTANTNRQRPLTYSTIQQAPWRVDPTRLI